MGWRRGALTLALLALVATGCRAQATLDVRVDADGAGTIALTLASDAALEAQARSAGVDPLGDLAATGRRLESSGWRVSEVVEDGGGRTVTLSFAFADPAEFAEVAAELVDALAAPELEPLGGLRLDLTDEHVAVEATAGLVPAAAVAELGLRPDEAVALLAEDEALTYAVTVALPGRILETNASDPEATPLRWEVEPGEQVRIVAVSERPRSPLPLALAGAGALALLILAGLLVRRRRPRAPP